MKEEIEKIFNSFMKDGITENDLSDLKDRLYDCLDNIKEKKRADEEERIYKLACAQFPELENMLVGTIDDVSIQIIFESLAESIDFIDNFVEQFNKNTDLYQRRYAMFKSEIDSLFHDFILINHNNAEIEKRIFKCNIEV